jgi:hypothetical protein
VQVSVRKKIAYYFIFLTLCRRQTAPIPAAAVKRESGDFVEGPAEAGESKSSNKGNKNGEIRECLCTEQLPLRIHDG